MQAGRRFQDCNSPITISSGANESITARRSGTAQGQIHWRAFDTGSVQREMVSSVTPACRTDESAPSTSRHRP
jgi:hypothetical protein